MFSISNLIIVVFLHLVGARNDSLSKNYQFSNQNLILADPSFDNKTLFFALYTKSTRQCSVVQEINPFTNSSITRKCNFAIKADNVKLIVAFGMEKAILIVDEATSKSLKLKTITIHMDDCKTVDVELVEVPLNWTNHKFYRDYIDVVVSESSFEVIIKGLSQLCSKPDVKIYCGISFDPDGNKIEGPLIWPKMAYDKIDIVSPVMADASGQGYFFVNRDSSLLAFQFNRKGGPKYVKLWYTPTPHSNLWREGYSVANKIDGMCYNVNSTVGCWQTDQEGELKINMEFEFDHKFKANIRQCNATKSSKIEDTTTQATTIQLTTLQETTLEEATTVATDTTTKYVTIEVNTTDNIGEDTEILPITVQGITLKESTMQNNITQNSTIEDDTNRDGSATTEDIIQINVTTEDNSVLNGKTEDITIINDPIQSNATESDTLQNNILEDNTTRNTVTLDNDTEEYGTMQDITVQGLTTQALITPNDIVTQENTTIESVTQNTTLQDITVQGITIQALKSMSQVKLITNEHQIWNLFIHNLRNGGFIILIVTCPNRICSGNDDHYYLMKINTQGKLIGQLEVNIKSKCNAEIDQVLVKVFENDQGQYCSIRLCKSKQQQDEKLEILVNCYCNADFK